ncbi:MAG TPA: VOC family protein [Candidatus Polarisedimenticolia bacterium]|nr:VOC family protein [Candidatus Polarisedimenticolia bacterium]
MSEEGGAKKPGTIGWIDLTVENADAVREFYEAVAGWKASGIDMGGYSDYAMLPPGADDAVAGVCHARGVNKGLPPQWLIYINVDNLDSSLEKVKGKGGAVVYGIRDMGAYGRMAVVRDPAGAVAGLFEPKK